MSERHRLLEQVRPFYEGLRLLPIAARDELCVPISFSYDEFLEPTSEWRFETYQHQDVSSFVFLETLFRPLTFRHGVTLQLCPLHSAPEEEEEDDESDDDPDYISRNGFPQNFRMIYQYSFPSAA